MSFRSRRSLTTARWLLLAMLWQALVGVAMHQHAHVAGEGRTAPATGWVPVPVACSAPSEGIDAEGPDAGRTAAAAEGTAPDDDRAAEPCAWCLAQADLAHPVGSAPRAVSVGPAVAVPGAVMPLPSTAPWWATPARGPPAA